MLSSRWLFSFSKKSTPNRAELCIWPIQRSHHRLPTLTGLGDMGRSVDFRATTPDPGYQLTTALLGEIITTFTMVSLLTLFLGVRHLRPYTPAIFPVLYSMMSFLEAAISGTSTNPARSLDPSVISEQWNGWWIY